jgi:hypothetical protein
VTDARGVPLVAHVTAANVNDIAHLDALVADLPAVRGRRGRPRRRPDVLQGDRGYDSQPHRDRRHDRVHHAFLTLGCALICWNYLKSTGRVF